LQSQSSKSAMYKALSPQVVTNPRAGTFPSVTVIMRRHSFFPCAKQRFLPKSLSNKPQSVATADWRRGRSFGVVVSTALGHFTLYVVPSFMVLTKRFGVAMLCRKRDHSSLNRFSTPLHLFFPGYFIFFTLLVWAVFFFFPLSFGNVRPF